MDGSRKSVEEYKDCYPSPKSLAVLSSAAWMQIHSRFIKSLNRLRYAILMNVVSVILISLLDYIITEERPCHCFKKLSNIDVNLDIYNTIHSGDNVSQL